MQDFWLLSFRQVFIKNSDSPNCPCSAFSVLNIPYKKVYVVQIFLCDLAGLLGDFSLINDLTQQRIYTFLMRLLRRAALNVTAKFGYLNFHLFQFHLNNSIIIRSSVATNLLIDPDMRIYIILNNYSYIIHNTSLNNVLDPLACALFQ